MRSFLLASVLLASGLAHAKAAAPERPPSAITIDGGRDSAAGSFGGLDAGIGLSNGDLIFAGGSTSRVKDSVTGTSSSTRSFDLGYTINPESLWSFTPSLDIWGARSDLTTRSFLFETELNLEDWSFGVQPEFKSLIWTAADHPNVKKRTGATGVHAHVEYLGIDHLTFELRAGSTNYGGQNFNEFIGSSFISDSAFAQTSGLVKSYYGGVVRLRAGDWRLSLKIQKTTYLVESATSTSVTAGLKWKFQPNWKVGYEFNSNKPNDAPAITSNALNLAFEW